jgi:2-haloacid dehalogenase
MYDHLLFDADGTLLDFVSAQRWALRQVFVSLDLLPTEDNLNIYSQINNEIWLEYEQGLITMEALKTERFKRFYAKFNLTGDYEATSKLYAKTLSQSYHLYDDALPTLQRLKENNIEMSMITNGISFIQKGRLKAAAIENYFKVIVISEEIGLQKPDPLYFEKTLDLIKERGINVNKALVIGDSLTSDIAGAVNAKLDSVWINRYHMERYIDVKPNYEITKLEQLFNVLNL